VAICPGCGEDNPDRFRLCGFCGTPLSTAPAPREQRRTVTVVFCDLKDSTKLGERLDPEALREVVNRYFAAMREVLESHGDPYLLGKTWTTDAIFRETRSKIQARRAEGAIVVEKETAALFAVGAFRNVLVAQLLYAGDNVGGESWDHREWAAQRSIRKSLFFLACEACCEAPI